MSNKQPESWTAATTRIKRFGDAMELLCHGVRPSDELLQEWLDPQNEGSRLQEFAMEHGPAWSQGIVVIDAALILASAPTEGVDHEMLEAPAKGKAPKTDSAQAPSSDARLEIEKLHRQLAEKALDATRAWQRYESSNRMCMSLQIERAKMVNQIHPAAPLLACAPRAAANGDNRGTALTCWCEACDLAQGELLGRTRMAICPNCGDKRCPRAIHHDAVCPASAARTPASDSQENPIG